MIYREITRLTFNGYVLPLATTESILDILVDIIHEFYLKLTHLLRAAVDRKELVRGTSFPVSCHKDATIITY